MSGIHFWAILVKFFLMGFLKNLGSINLIPIRNKIPVMLKMNDITQKVQ